MIGEYEFFLVIAGVILVLLAATFIAEWMQSRFSPNYENAAIDREVMRVYSWWYLVLILALAIFFGQLGIVILFGLVSFGAMREFLTHTAKSRADHLALVLCYYILLPAQYIFVYFGLFDLIYIFIPVYGFFLLSIVQALKGDTARFLSRVAETQWALMICVYSVSYVAALAGMEIAGFEGKGFLLIVFLILVTQSSEILQYLFGKVIGTRPISPNISRSQTWEGLIAGIASASILGAALYWITPFTPLVAFFLALMLCVLGFLGRFVIKAIKRDKGVQLWSNMIAGYGGVVDRLGAVVFSAPVFFHIVWYFWI